MSWIHSKRHPNVGASPGTLVILDESPTPRIRYIDYSATKVDERNVKELSELEVAFDKDSITWIDVQGFGDRQVIEGIGALFELHPLLLEDLVNIPQRPKAESYEHHLLVICRMIHLVDHEEIVTEQVSIVLGENYVLTFQEKYDDALDPVRQRIRSRKGGLQTHGADYLAYALIDTIVDAYYPVLERIGDRLEDLEDQVIQDPSPELLGVLHRLKNHLNSMRRTVWPEREAVNTLARDPEPFVSDEVRIFFRDTYDHIIQASEITEMYRDMVTGLMNTYLTSVSNRTNDVMKVLTIVATIFIPLTFISGVYGMNFDRMPELHLRWAYPAVWLLMISVAGGMTYFFWRKGWLKRNRPQVSD